ncbi:uncharacterized protein JN550_013515 [Neoarthrinium moseri]|uniref:uncharacterized protein n=1 Tax=Neoarthrinium moseri TaxID=1658444 RepID=UPI001FDC4E1A|nr:uncharacterized protein JN550_013515 [Neoarthrinium moseri]KAI1856984.1 hypothetical protein JN550_013515 [Neoarthrinium moseri]
MPEGQGPTNPFVRFKDQVDNQVSQAWQGIQSLPFESAESDRSVKMAEPGVRSTTAVTADSNDIDTPSQRDISVGGGAVEHVAERLRRQTVHSWLKYSPYSPLHLDGLRQPVPNDAPGHYDQPFTFRDAFEDLLTTSSGRPPQDVEQMWLAARSRHAPLLSWADFSLFAAGSGDWEWASSLERRRLWDSYFPRPAFRDGAREILHKVSALRYPSRADAERHTSMLIKQAAGSEAEAGYQSTIYRLGLFDAQPGAVRRELRTLNNPWRTETAERGEDRFTQGVQVDGRDRRSAEEIKPEGRPANQDGHEPNSFEDLCQALKSRYAQATASVWPSWDAIFNNFHDKWPEPKSGPAPDSTTNSETSVAPDGSQVITTTEWQTLRGGTQKKVITERRDPSGNITQQSTVTQFISGSMRDQTGQERHDHANETNSDGNSGGWFWTKRG